MELFDLKGRTGIITGASSGIGLGTANVLAEAGAKIYALSRTGGLKDSSEYCHENIIHVKADVCDREQMEEKVKEIGEKDGIDFLINNAGVLDTGLKAIDKYLDDDAEKVIAINEVGTMQCIRAALGHMESGASIVNVASVAGYNGGGGAVYVASKAAIIGITKHTAMLLADKYIRCNAVCPGNIVTPMTMGLNPAQLDMNMMGAMNKHGDLSLKSCQAEDVANILLFLASDESKALTGQIMVSDFGVNL